MKKLPLTLIPVLLFVVFLSLFAFVPKDGDLISAKGDFFVGQGLGMLTFVFLFIDVRRFVINKR
jgi:hypothetical protein